ncbi:MAG: DUF4838 domain-containing protein [Clostridia bacterium]|nr:DUF4838 domain-containing protein [Clostridia bacterium]
MKITLIRSNATDYSIVIPVNFSPVEQTAAEELQHYLKKAFGIGLDLKTERESVDKAFYLGHTEYAKKAGIIGKSKENWIIKMHNGNPVLTGGVEKNDRGIIYSVYHFLEDVVGVRWWNYWEEDIPSLTDLVLESTFCKEGTPFFYYRKNLHNSHFEDFYHEARIRGNVVGEDDGLPGGVFHPSLKKLGGAMPMGRPSHVHTLDLYYPAEEYFDQHPDWFAWSDALGKRVSYGHYCLANSEFLEAILKKLMAYIEEDERLAEEENVEKPVFYSISFPDCFEELCQCDACKKIIKKSGPSGYALQFVNQIARRVAKKYPHVKIETLAYSIYLEKPLDDTLPEKNVIIRLAQVFVDIIHSIHDRGNAWYLQLLKDWSEICKKAGCDLYIWEYMYNLFFTFPTCVPNRLSDTYRAFYEYDVKGVFVENENIDANMWELTHYLLAHLAEDPLADCEALMEDFMIRYYGPAAPFVKEYYQELVRAATENNYSVYCVIESVHFNYLDARCVKRGMELLNQAIEATKDNSVIQDRILYLRAILGMTLLIKYFDLQKNAALFGETFEFDREAIRTQVLYGLERAMEDPKYAYTRRLHNEAEYVRALSFDKEEAPPLPNELADVNPENVYQFFFKNTCRHINDHHNYGVTIVEDPSSSTGKVERICFDEAKSRHLIMGVFLTSKYTEHKRSISIDIEQDAKRVSGIELYKEDVFADEYHLYKVGEVSGIRESGDTRVDIFGNNNFDWVSLTGISVAFPMDACDVYLSMKFTGAMYGGKKEDAQAVYIDRVIIVRK